MNDINDNANNILDIVAKLSGIRPAIAIALVSIPIVGLTSQVDKIPNEYQKLLSVGSTVLLGVLAVLGIFSVFLIIKKFTEDDIQQKYESFGKMRDKNYEELKDMLKIKDEEITRLKSQNQKIEDIKNTDFEGKLSQIGNFSLNKPQKTAES